MYDLEGNFLEVLETPNVYALEKRLKITRGSLDSCLKGKTLTCNGRQFRTVRGTRTIQKIGDVSKITDTSMRTAAHKYYKGRYICTYTSATEAAEVNNTNPSDISKCLSGSRRTAGGYEWKKV